jgi:hypothetical protein
LGGDDKLRLKTIEFQDGMIEIARLSLMGWANTITVRETTVRSGAPHLRRDRRLLSSAEAIAASYAKALIVDREKLHGAQQDNDAMMGFQALRQAHTTDVSPILAQARVEAGGAADVLGVYRASGYRGRKAQERRPVGLGAGIV